MISITAFCPSASLTSTFLTLPILVHLTASVYFMLLASIWPTLTNCCASLWPYLQTCRHCGASRVSLYRLKCLEPDCPHISLTIWITMPGTQLPLSNHHYRTIVLFSFCLGIQLERTRWTAKLANSSHAYNFILPADCNVVLVLSRSSCKAVHILSKPLAMSQLLQSLRLALHCWPILARLHNALD